MTEQTEMIGMSDAAELLDLKYQTLYQRVVRGFYEDLEYTKRKGQIRFRKSDILEIKHREERELEAFLNGEDVA